MVKKALIIILIVAAIGGGAWYYFSRTHHTSIESILANPGAYGGKEVTIEGVVTDRTSFFVVAKFYKVKDQSGEITVVTKKTLPQVKSTVRAKGRIDDAFQVGDQKLTVFVEESVEEKAVDK